MAFFHFRSLSILSLFLLVRALFIIMIILLSGIGLGPDEAQYWTWSQFLDWGYYSKPPGIAWQIWAGTKLFGNTELGVRFASIVFGILLSYATYFLSLCCNAQPRTSFWAALIISLIPLGVLGSLFAITDVGLVLFWTLSYVFISKAISNKTPPNYYILGGLILCGALFKWPMYLIWVVILVPFLIFPYFRSFHLIGGIFISLIGLAPSVIWNMSHDWATFRHVSATVAGGEEKKIRGNLIEFFGSQAGLLSPIIFFLLLVSFAYLLRRRKEIPHAQLFVGMSTLFIFLFYLILSCFQKIQGNWCSYIYPPAIVFLAWMILEQKKSLLSWLKGGLLLSILLMMVVFSIPYIQSNAIFNIPYRFNLFKHNVGWEQLSSHLIEAGYDPKKDFLFGDKYQMSSILSFYGPQQKRAYFLNLHGIRKNQFSYWPSMAQEQVGKTGYFVFSENAPHLEKNEQSIKEFYQKNLEKYFEEVHFEGLLPLFESYGTMSKGMFIYKCINYNGLEPNTDESY